MRNVVISLFDYTGNMVKPWADAGYDCLCFDLQHKGFCTKKGGIRFVRANLSKRVPSPFLKDSIAMVFAFPPCDHLAVSGARWFKGKGLRCLSNAISLFATAAEFCEETGAPYMIENPVSTISTYWRKPDYTFHPHEYTAYCAQDNYTKKTCLWTGNGFVMPEPNKDMSLSAPDDRIHKAAPSEGRKNFRSATPEGFAKAVFYANGRKLHEDAAKAN